jgi:hypothetical protein
MFRNEDQKFSYSSLPPAHAHELRAIAGELRPLLTNLNPIALQAGRLLRSAKEIVKHGLFSSFCRNEMKTEVRMCQYYIKIADLADAIGEDVVGLMPASAAAALSSASPDVVSQVVAEINDGKACPSVREIKERVRESRAIAADSSADDRHDDSDDGRVAKVADFLTMRLEQQELADLTDFLNTAGTAAIAALCQKIHVFTAS